MEDTLSSARREAADDTHASKQELERREAEITSLQQQAVISQEERLKLKSFIQEQEK